MNICELIELAKNRVVTQEDVDRLWERVRLADLKDVEREENKRVTNEVLNRSYGI